LGADQAIDVLALQELKMTDDKFPHRAFTDAGCHAQWFGQKTYNGVALISRTPAVDVVKNIPGFEDRHLSRITLQALLAMCASLAVIFQMVKHLTATNLFTKCVG